MSMYGMLGALNGGGAAAELASRMNGFGMITYANFPSQEAICETARREGFAHYNDSQFLEEVTQKIEEITGISRPFR